MSQKILVLAGKKQSGKSSTANFIAGYMLTQLGRQGVPFCPTQFTLDEEGNLIVNTVMIDAEGETIYGDGILDLSRRDEDFVVWASNIMWPHIKLYNFADTLKQVAVTVFGLDPEKVYGTNEDKKTLTKIKWRDMCTFLPPRTVGDLKKSGKYDKCMSVREFLQYFGTNVCRKLYDGCWAESTFRRIAQEGSDLAVIGDGRFKNEIILPKERDVRTMKFTRSIDEDLHESEKELDAIPDSKYTAVIDNKYMTLKEKNQAVLDVLYEWGWFSGYVTMEEK